MKRNNFIAKIARKGRWFSIDLLVKFGWKPKLKRAKGSVRILVFHGVCLDHEPFINGRFIHQTQLDHLLTGISKHFHPISITDFLNGKLNNSRLNVVCTFDDGYKNNIVLASEIFEKHQVPFTVFCNAVPYHLMDLLDICQVFQPELLKNLIVRFRLDVRTTDLKSYCRNESPGAIKKMSDFLWEGLNPTIKENSKRFWEVLSDEELVELNHSPLVSFGNHGAAHVNYLQLSENEILEDIHNVNRRLNAFGIEPIAFAYPYGLYSEVTISAVQKAGFDKQFSDDFKNSNPAIVPRFTINPFISIENQLIAIAKGKY